MKALITGSAGQDGTYLSEHLTDLGYAVIGLDLLWTPNIARAYTGDVRDSDLVSRILRAERPAEVYHLASPMPASRSWDDPELFFETNVQGFLNILRGAREIGARVYHQASSDMFGRSSPQDETTPLAPRNPYALSKAAAVRLGQLYRERWGLPVSCGIAFHHSSPRQTEESVVWKVVRAAQEASPSRPITLGNLDAVRDWSHAADIVRAQHLILQQPPGEWVIGSGVGRTVRELAETALRLAGKSEDWIEVDPRFMRADDWPLIANPAKLHTLGWTPLVTFEEMLSWMMFSEMLPVLVRQAATHS